MKVAPGQRDTWGEDLSRSADLITEDESTIAVRPAEIGYQMRLTLDPECTAAPKHVYLNAGECEELAELLLARARELRSQA